jgi:hypothetical protein
MRRRIPQKLEFVRIHVGDVQFTDDPNDDWFCISFNSVYIGDYCPNCLYINKMDGRIKVEQSSLFAQLLGGYFVNKSLEKYKFQEHHRKILEHFVNESFHKYITKTVNNKTKSTSLKDVLITMTQQRV